MKRYMILKKVGTFSADEVRQFDNLDDARMFRNLLNTSEDCKHVEFIVVEVLEEGFIPLLPCFNLPYIVCSYNMQLNLFDDITSVANKMYKNRIGRA